MTIAEYERRMDKASQLLVDRFRANEANWTKRLLYRATPHPRHLAGPPISIGKMAQKIDQGKPNAIMAPQMTHLFKEDYDE